MNEEGLLTGVVAALREVTGEDGRWADAVRPDSRLEEDLSVDSLEMAALGEVLRRRYGDRVALPEFVAGLEIDEIIALTVADLVAYLTRCGVADPDGSGLVAETVEIRR